jgi:hypothetical protein
MSINQIRKNLFGFGLTALLSVGMLAGSATPALAHEAKCPYCKLDVVQDTKEQDNEVILRYGNKRIEYRCVMCAIAQAKTKFKNDVTILAPSNVKGKPVTITRVNGEWKTDPEGALFVSVKGSHTECQIRYRAVASKEEFEKYVQANHEILKDAKPLTLKEMVELSK